MTTGGQDDALISVEDLTTEPEPDTPLNLNVASLRAHLPALRGDDEETIEQAGFIRAGAIAEVMRLEKDAWERESPDARATPECKRKRIDHWKSRVTPLVAVTDAHWWVAHGHKEAGGVIHAANTLAAARTEKNA